MYDDVLINLGQQYICHDIKTMPQCNGLWRKKI